MKLSIVIPMYNEEKTIRKVVEAVKDLRLNIEKEVIVVDDGSIDRGFDNVKSVKGIILLRHDKNKGKGAAVKTAIEKATGDILIVQDADLELNPKEIPKIIKLIVENRADVVYGSRNLYEKEKNRSLLFWLGGHFITWTTNLIYGTKLTDEPCGYKAFKTSVLKSIKIENNRFEWEPEVTAKIAMKGIKIHEVPVVSSSRSIKEGKKLRRRDGVRAFITLIKYRFKS